jgi:hypothetical protein
MENQEDVKSLKSKVLSAMGMTEEAEVLALKSEVADMQATLEQLKKDFNDALKTLQEEFTKTLTEALTPVEEDEPEDADAETEAEASAEKSMEEQVKEEEDEVEEEEVETEEPVSEKGESKAEPVHDNLSAEKSKPVNIYEIMGRNADGTRKH